MSNELLTILESIEQERGINRDALIEAVEKALMSASRKSIHPANKVEIKIDRKTGDIRAWATLEVVERFPNNDQIKLEEAKERMPDVNLHDIIQWEVTPKNFGRIAAQTAKQAIMQHLRRAEKAIVKEEFQDQIGQIVNGVVRRFESGNIIVDLHKAEGIIQPKDKIPGEQYMSGDRINALLVKVETSGSGPSLILSRSHPDFVRRLFEREVTEIHDGVVQIMGIAREAGGRSKIAVKSNDQRVDPIGACVGMRGMRVKNITNELGGERIDIIRFDENIKTYAANALQPAKPRAIEVEEAKRSLNVFVSAEQSRLAFGKRAQNVRLCSKLLGWNFNIVIDKESSEETFEQKKGRMITHLSEILGIENSTAEKLVNNGFVSIEGLKAVDASEVASIEGLSEEESAKIIESLAQIQGDHEENEA